MGQRFCCTIGNDMRVVYSYSASFATYHDETKSSISVVVEMGGMPASYAMVSMIGYPYQNSTWDESQ